MQDTRRDALVSRLADTNVAVEVGIGRQGTVAGALASRGVDVTATDIREQPILDGVRFVIDDVTAPDRSVYADADLLYALNLPPELHRPTWELAQAVDAEFLFTTLGGDQPAIPVTRETLPGETLFVAKPKRP